MVPASLQSSTVAGQQKEGNPFQQAASIAATASLLANSNTNNSSRPFFAPAIARQSTGMLEAAELFEYKAANRYTHGEGASEKSHATAGQLVGLQREAAEALRLQQSLKAYTRWRDYPSVPFYGSMAGVRISVLSAAASPSSAIVSGGGDAQPSSSSARGGRVKDIASSLLAAARALNPGTGIGGDASIISSPSSKWELSTLPNESRKVTELMQLSRSTAGNRVPPIVAAMGGDDANSLSSKASRFYRNHCCYYQFGPDLLASPLESASSAVGGDGQLAAASLTGPGTGGRISAASSAQTGAAGGAKPTASTTATTSVVYNINDTASYMRYIEAFVSAFDVFAALNTAYRARIRGMNPEGKMDAASSSSAASSNSDANDIFFQDFDLQSTSNANVSLASKDGSLPPLTPKTFINDHTLTLVCTAHPRHKNFSLHVFSEGGGGATTGAASSSALPRISAVLVSDSASFQKEISFQLKKVLGGGIADDGDASTSVEWFGGAFFVQDDPNGMYHYARHSSERGRRRAKKRGDAKKRSEVEGLGASSVANQSAVAREPNCVSPVYALVDVILNINMLCETTTVAAPVMGGRGAPMQQPATTTTRVHKGSCTIVTSFPFSGGQQKELLLRPLEPVATTIPYQRTYASLASKEEGMHRPHQTTSSGVDDGVAAAAVRFPPPSPLPATRHAFLLGASSVGGNLVTPRCLRAVLHLLIDMLRLNSCEIEGLLCAPSVGTGGHQQRLGGGGTAVSGGDAANVGTAPATATGLAAVTARSSTAVAGGADGGGRLLSSAHAALSSLEVGGNGIVSHRLFPTRLCVEPWVTCEEQEAQGVAQDDSGLPMECIFYPSRIAFRRVDAVGTLKQPPPSSPPPLPLPIRGQKRDRDDDGTTPNTGDDVSFLRGNFCIDNTVLWYLEEEDYEEE